VRISTEICLVPMPTCFRVAEGSIRQQPFCEVVPRSAVSLAQDMFSQRLAGNPRELPISFTSDSVQRFSPKLVSEAFPMLTSG
jgi:hypothetical protein